ncbi:hypothetical protein D3C78_1479590 [compost metagenome]
MLKPTPPHRAHHPNNTLAGAALEPYTASAGLGLGRTQSRPPVHYTVRDTSVRLKEGGESDLIHDRQCIYPILIECVMSDHSPQNHRSLAYTNSRQLRHHAQKEGAQYHVPSK